MPELPEVQTIVSDLNSDIVGEKIVDFWSDWKRSVRPNFSKFKKEIFGKKIVRVRRIGKQIILDLSGGKSIIIHLKMSGHLLYKKTKIKNKKEQKYFNEKVNQYIHHKFIFKSKAVLEFSDLRKFAWLSIVDTKKVEKTKEISLIGIDALDRKFTLKKFKEILSKKQKSIIGVLLLNQHLIAGIGNIYRSEILFLAGVNPKRKISTLKENEIKKIFKAIKLILKKAVKNRGTSDADYRDLKGKKGNYQKFLKVYRKDGQKCFKCSGIIVREKLNQRSIFFCPKCQK